MTQLRQGLREHADPVIACTLALALTVEVVLYPTAQLATAVPACLLAALPQIWRRKRPIAAFLGSLAGVFAIHAAAPGWNADAVSFMVLYFLALYSLGAWSRGVEVPISAGIVVACIALFALTDGGAFHPADVIFATGIVGGPWAAGLVIRLRRDHASRLAADNEVLQADQEERARRAVAEERARIARELHDVVSHAISVTVLQARGARRTLGHDEGQVRLALDAIELTNTAALSDMRRLLAVLRDTEDAGSVGGEPHAPQPTLDQLESLVDQVRASGVPVKLEIVGQRLSVPPGVDLSAYRIVQEALTNVIKHAGPASATVTLTFGPDALDVLIRDTGAGGRVNGTGHGLIGIRERVAVVGGEVVAGPGDRGGFTVDARLPYSLEAL
jgi:signal transduction histidine kinase